MMKKIAAAALLVCFVSAPLLAQKYASINTTKANIRTCAGTKCAVKFYAWKYTPVIMVKASPDKEWVQVKDFEGFTVFQVTKAGKTSATTVCFAPKPPPIRGFVTRIFDLGIPSALEIILRTWKTIWVELITFSLP